MAWFMSLMKRNSIFVLAVSALILPIKADELLPPLSCFEDNCHPPGPFLDDPYMVLRPPPRGSSPYREWPRSTLVHVYSTQEVNDLIDKKVGEESNKLRDENTKLKQLVSELNLSQQTQMSQLAFTLLKDKEFVAILKEELSK